MLPINMLRLFITNYCDQSCLHCHNSRLYSKENDFLSLEIIKRRVQSFIDKNPSGNHQVLISGGEPTLHPDFLQVLTFLKAHENLKVIVVTNGLRFLNEPNFFQQFLALKIPTVIFSLETSAQDYEYLRHLNRYEDLLALIKKLKLLSPVTEVSINVCAYKGNKENFIPFIKELLKHKRLLHFIRIIALNEIESDKTYLSLSVEEELNLLKALENDPDIDMSKIRFINSELGHKELHDSV